MVDTAYQNIVTFDYTEKNKSSLTPTSKQTRQKKNKLNPKPFHKDNFTYDSKRDIFICPKGHPLHHKYELSKKYDEKCIIIKNIRVYEENITPNCPFKEEYTPKT